MHIAMVAPLFPAKDRPVEAAGMRTFGLAAGLRQHGHDVTVVCSMPPGAEPECPDGVDVVIAPWLDLEQLVRSTGSKSGTLVASKRANGSPRHTVARRVARRFLPDRFATWIPGAVRAVRRVARPDSIILSTGARSAHIAARLGHDGHPWIADVNDLWAGNPHLPALMGHRVEGALERWTIGSADWVTTVNDAMREELGRRHDVPVSTILSGFTPADFEKRPAHRAHPRPLHILFSGTVYLAFDLEPLYAALRSGKEEGWATPEALQVSFVGRLTERVAIEAERFGVGDLIQTSAPIPRDELLDRLVRADALLLPLYENDPYALPMRFFEYVGAGRPIIGLGPPGRIAGRLISQHRLGTVVSDEAELQDLLRDLVLGTARLPRPTPGRRNQFTWERSSDALDEVLHEAVARMASHEPAAVPLLATALGHDSG
jgi:glycosyltransferase involved in cell wall biosynthesis